jgi:ADP-heptose:LPS heptosyltransferase
LHVAGTTATPVVGLFGPTLAERSMPWRDPRLPAEAVEPGALACRPCDQRHCVPGDFRCLTGISPAQVIDAAERLLARAAVG